MIWIRALAFIVVVQLSVVAFIPWLLAAIGPRVPLGSWRLLGVALVALGVAAILWCNYAFVARGRGTAAPYEPPRELVVEGLYRYVRNPMYGGALFILLGEALWSGAVSLLVYASLLGLAYMLFVRFYEEPHLRRLFGDAYDRYCSEVPAWLPRRPR